VANNLSLAVAIADAASAAPENPENIAAAAETLTVCYPESDASLSEIVDAIRDQRDRSLTVWGRHRASPEKPGIRGGLAGFGR